MNPYPWLDIGEDSWGASIGDDCTPAEADRRIIIMQELRSGRLIINPDWNEKDY